MYIALGQLMTTCAILGVDACPLEGIIQTKYDEILNLIDTDYVCIGHLPGRMFSVSDVAPVGDATRFAIVSEYTLIVKAPKSHAAVIGLNGS